MNTVLFKDDVKSYCLLHSGTAIPYGIGCAWLGRSGLDPDMIRNESLILHKGFELGFRYFDTSLQYGESEIITGEFVKDVPRGEIFLATKTPIPDTATAKQAAEVVKRNLDHSLRRLQTDYLDLYQLHDIGTLENVLHPDHVLQVLYEAKKSGLIRYFGLATRDLRLLKEAAFAGFDSILTYSDFTPIEQPASGLIETVHSLGVGVVNASPLAAGLLIGTDPSNLITGGREETSRKLLAVELYQLCSEFPFSLRTFALQFPLRNKLIDMNLTGPSNMEHINSAYQSLTESVPPALWQAWEDWNDKKRRSLYP